MVVIPDTSTTLHESATADTKSTKATKNGEGVGTTVASTHEDGQSCFVFFLPFFVVFVAFVLGRLVAAALR